MAIFTNVPSVVKGNEGLHIHFSSTTHTIDRGWRNILRRNAKIASGIKVKAGFVEGNPIGYPSRGSRKQIAARGAWVNMQEIATVANKHERGFAGLHERPFVGPSFDKNVARISSQAKIALRNYLKKSSVDGFSRVGETMARAMRAKINAGGFYPLSPNTYRRKIKPAKTLIETRQMYNTIGSKVFI